MQNKYTTLIQYDNTDNIYIAYIPDLPGCMAHGATKEDALKELAIAYELWIDTAKEVGKFESSVNSHNDHFFISCINREYNYVKI